MEQERLEIEAEARAMWDEIDEQMQAAAASSGRPVRLPVNYDNPFVQFIVVHLPQALQVWEC